MSHEGPKLGNSSGLGLTGHWLDQNRTTSWCIDMTPNKPTDKPDLQALLVEYEKAQDSAQHHDSLLWTSVSFIFGGMLVLLGFVLDSLDKKEAKSILWIVSVLGILLTVVAVLIAFQFNRVKQFKYDRCREIEEQIGGKQHQNVPHWP
jgi:hypothetical protein